MDRRMLIRSVLGLIGAPFLAHAQAPRPAGKIGYLDLDSISSMPATNANISLLRPAWQRLGYVEGDTMLLRFAEHDVQRLPQLVAELLALNVGVLIVAAGRGSQDCEPSHEGNANRRVGPRRPTRFVPDSPRALLGPVAM